MPYLLPDTGEHGVGESNYHREWVLVSRRGQQPAMGRGKIERGRVEGRGKIERQKERTWRDREREGKR